MKKLWRGGVVLLLMVNSFSTRAQVPLAEIIKQGVKKVILAVDLKVQRLLNKTIWLQNAQKELENVLSKTKLDDISGWAEKQKDLYGDYFDELRKVKDAIALYHRVKEIGEKQVLIVSSYRKNYQLFRQDAHFSAAELEYMDEVYSGMIGESLKNLDQLSLVVNAMTTQMPDAERIRIINAAGASIDRVYNDMQSFNNGNRMLSMHRSKDEADLETVKRFYGFNP